VAGVYNPELRRVEWNQAYQSGVAGVYNPEKKKVQWKTAIHSGVAMVRVGDESASSCSFAMPQAVF
jgi:hypothetical protein